MRRKEATTTTTTTCNAWNNDDHELYSSTDNSDNSNNKRVGEQNTGSLDEGDMFEGETYLRASESLQEKTKRYE
jgi:hypothetical protein